jgi:hypothetical protein
LRHRWVLDAQLRHLSSAVANFSSGVRSTEAR